MVAGRLRKKENMSEAIKIQDRLSKKSGSWNGSEEIRKWRGLISSFGILTSFISLKIKL